jgi:hypothetical protein
MRSFAAAILGFGLVALAGSAVAQTEGGVRFDGSYSAIARGMNAGEFNFHFLQSGPTYQVSAQRRLTGFARTLFGSKQDYSYSVRGSVGDQGVLMPDAYQHQGGSRNRVVRSTFSPTDVVTTAEPHMGMGNPPASAMQRRGVIDQLTAIASLLTSQTDPCTRTLHVYMDGRSRFDFVLTPAAQVNINSPAFRGPGVRCNVEFRPIAGFSDPQQVEHLSFLFGRTQSGLYAPVTIEMPSDDVGTIRLEARTLSVNGAPLS